MKAFSAALVAFLAWIPRARVRRRERETRGAGIVDESWTGAMGGSGGADLFTCVRQMERGSLYSAQLGTSLCRIKEEIVFLIKQTAAAGPV